MERFLPVCILLCIAAVADITITTLFNRPDPSPPKSPGRIGVLIRNMVLWGRLGPAESTIQTSSRSVELLLYSSAMSPTDRHMHTRGAVLKKKWGDAWNKTWTKIFKQFRPTYTYTHTRQKNCHSGSLVLSCDTATRVWVSVADRY